MMAIFVERQTSDGQLRLQITMSIPDMCSMVLGWLNVVHALKAFSLTSNPQVVLSFAQPPQSLSLISPSNHHHPFLPLVPF
jgi:hypothetical protein